MRNKNFFMLPNRIFSLGLKPKEFATVALSVIATERKTDAFRQGD